MKSFETVEREARERRTGWWDRVVQLIPELGTLSDTPQPSRFHAEGAVDQHTRLAVEACPTDCEPDLLWAALLHDVGKPLATRRDGDKITAHGHQKIGAEMAQAILFRLGMPPYRTERIVWVVRHHTFHLSWNLKSPKDASPRQKRFVSDPRFPLLLELLRVDSIASLGSASPMKPYELYKELREGLMKSKRGLG